MVDCDLFTANSLMTPTSNATAPTSQPQVLQIPAGQVMVSCRMPGRLDRERYK